MTISSRPRYIPELKYEIPQPEAPRVSALTETQLARLADRALLAESMPSQADSETVNSYCFICGSITPNWGGGCMTCGSITSNV